MFSLDERVVVVTGAGQGIGRAATLHFAGIGATVVGADINREKVEAVIAEVTGTGCPAMAAEVDVSDEAGVESFVSEVIDKYGRIDVLLNNAAVFTSLKLKPVEEISVAEWDQVMAVNLRGTFLCSRAVVPHMKREGQGRIINMSSTTVFMGRPYYLHYVTSKAGIIGLTRALAKELAGTGITVNAVTAGPVQTEIERDTLSPADAERLMNQRCVRRTQTPEDLMPVLTLLASDGGSYLSGQTINVDGG